MDGSGRRGAIELYEEWKAILKVQTRACISRHLVIALKFEVEDWGQIEFSIMAKHFERQGKPPYTYHSQYMAHLLSHGQLEDGSS
ncbi:uncharacterized protein M6B38_202225 [Iris pallida]|uniref:Uncharacterized protein n=1 Tax=Iris pallida TaxID=29817 RepID=A0AAX6E9Z1_IRIPA|nr:uncharacterized protein M6B38_202225 [Iris pallida]